MRDVEALAVFILGLLIVGGIADTEDWLGDRVDLIELVYLAASAVALTLVWCLRALRRRR
jgi:hypothetical protein